MPRHLEEFAVRLKTDVIDAGSGGDAERRVVVKTGVKASAIDEVDHARAINAHSGQDIAASVVFVRQIVTDPDGIGSVHYSITSILPVTVTDTVASPASIGAGAMSSAIATAPLAMAKTGAGRWCWAPTFISLIT